MIVKNVKLIRIRITVDLDGKHSYGGTSGSSRMLSPEAPRSRTSGYKLDRTWLQKCPCRPTQVGEFVSQRVPVTRPSVASEAP